MRRMGFNLPFENVLGLESHCSDGDVSENELNEDALLSV